jgi:hypothetical protein
MSMRSFVGITPDNNPEINNILEGLVNLNYLIRSELGNDDLVREYLALSDGQLERLRVLIQPLLH